MIEPTSRLTGPYQPFATQERFHVDSRHRFKGFSGPVGSGKSMALAYEAYFLSQLNPGCWGLIGAPTYPMLRDSTQRSFWEVMEREDLQVTFHKSENRVTLPNGSQILFRSLENFERLRGTNLAWFGVDELTYCRPEAWQRLEARLRDQQAVRLEGFAGWTPKGFDWVYEMFVSDPKPSYQGYLAAPRENTTLPPDYYDKLISSYDPQFAKQEVEGQYLNIFAGQAYYAFKREDHLRSLDYDPRLPLCWSLDFNVNPMCSIIAQIADTTTRLDALYGNRIQTVHILDEIYILNSNTLEACQEFVNRTQKFVAGGARQLNVNVYGDATGNARQTAAGAGARSDWEMVKQVFQTHPSYKMSYKYRTSNPHERDRVGAMNAALCNAAGMIRCFVDPRCRMLIRDFERVAWKAGAAILDKQSDPMLTHASDAAGYLIVSEMPLRQSVGPQPGRIV